MILSAQSIRRRCVEHNPPLIDPFVERGVSPGGKLFGLSAASYDVRLDQRVRVPPHGFPMFERFSMPIDVAGTVRDKPACGDGGMAAALRSAGCARVYATDIVARGGCQDEVLDFLSAQSPKLERFDLICTNPPYGQGGKLATAFIEVGLKRLGNPGLRRTWRWLCGTMVRAARPPRPQRSKQND